MGCCWKWKCVCVWHLLFSGVNLKKKLLVSRHGVFGGITMHYHALPAKWNFARDAKLLSVKCFWCVFIFLLRNVKIYRLAVLMFEQGGRKQHNLSARCLAVVIEECCDNQRWFWPTWQRKVGFKYDFAQVFVNVQCCWKSVWFCYSLLILTCSILSTMK